MSLSNGRHYLAIPGPSVVPDSVLQAMHRPAPNIYTGELVDMVASILPDLKAVARTKHQVAIYIANGHGIWEASLANCFSRGDEVLVLATGTFARGWADMAKSMHLKPEVMDFGDQSPIDPARVEERLRADTENRIKAVLAVQVDTATSIRSDIAELRQAMDASGHGALLMVDCIACLGCDRFEMDVWGVDVMLAGCQKGLMTPPGMGFIFFNDKADAVRETADLATAYWDWRPRVWPGVFYEHFCGTAPTHHLYGLRVALDMILKEEGLEAVWRRHETLARAIWAAFESWSADGPMALNVANPDHRSRAVTSANLLAPLGTELRTWLTENAGVTLGIGLGMAPPDDPAWHGYFRVGHMGHVNAHMVLGVLASIDSGLKAMRIPHGQGALEAATKVVGSV